MEDNVRVLLAELTTSLIVDFPDRDAVTNKPIPFCLHCVARTFGVGATLEQERRNSSIRPIIYICRATLANYLNWASVELEAGSIV